MPDFDHLGAIERKPKVSDFPLGAFVTTDPIPESFGLDGYNLAYRNQRKQPSCGAHSGSELKEILHQVSKEENVPLSPRFLWKNIKDMDGFPVEDGTSLDAIMKTLANKGVCNLTLAPDYSSLPIDEYRNLQETSTMIVDARMRMVKNYAFEWYPDFDKIKRAIYEKKAVIVLIRIGKEFWTDKDGDFSYKEKDIFPLRVNEPITSGHFVTAYAYDKDYIYFYNHWGGDWGRQGIGYFGKEYAEKRVVEMGTAVDATKYLFTLLLKRGSIGFEVSMLQYRLGTLAMDGVFGPKTEAAVKEFQRSNGLEADGIVGAKTRAKLND